MRESQKLYLSVVICTYNREQILTHALSSFESQTASRDDYEIIVVDNASTDNTRGIILEFTKKIKNLRYCYEPHQGLSFARNRGWMEAQGLFVAYVDDDAKVPENYVFRALEIIKQGRLEIFGGPYKAFYCTKKPLWFKDDYGSKSFGDQARFLEKNEYLSGSNMIFRRELLENHLGFKTDLGMFGNQLGYGEETDLQKKIRINIPTLKIFYDPDLFVYHLVNPEKFRIINIVRQRFLSGYFAYYILQQPRITAKNSFHLLALFLVVGLSLTGSLVASLLFRDRNQYPYYQNYLYERTFKRIENLGALFFQLENMRDTVQDKSRIT